MFFYTTGEFRLVYQALFKVELGLDGGEFFVDNFYVWFTGIPRVGSLKIGQFTAPMSLAALTSGSSDITFMEMGSPAEAFAPGTKAGLQLANSILDHTFTWALGWFAGIQDNPVGDASDSISRVVGRMTWSRMGGPQSAEKRLVHLGLSGSYVFSSNARVRYKSRPESFLAPALVDTGDLDAKGALLFGVEAAAVRGPFSVQAEYLASSVRAAEIRDPYFGGAYVFGSWFLTGESRPYDRETGVFGHVIPRRSFSVWKGQWGAWEVGARYSYVNLTDRDVRGGRMSSVTAGLNWYMNRHVRLMFNYNYADVGGGPNDGSLHTFQGRFQLVI